MSQPTQPAPEDENLPAQFVPYYRRYRFWADEIIRLGKVGGIMVGWGVAAIAVIGFAWSLFALNWQAGLFQLGL